MIENLANQAVMANIKVETAWMSRNEAEARYGFRLYQGGAVPGKDIRVVKTGEWDVEACAGTHLRNTGEVGFLKIVYAERIQDGVERLGYAIGTEALKAVQHQENILWKVSETLGAPVEKLDKTAQRLVKEFKKAASEVKRLNKELAAKDVSVAKTIGTKGAEKIGEIDFRLFEFRDNATLERMIQTTAEAARISSTVAVATGSIGNEARLVISAGKIAVEKGVDAGEIVREVSQLIGGGGGGRRDFAQGGGTKPEKLAEAVGAARKAIKRQLRAQRAIQ